MRDIISSKPPEFVFSPQFIYCPFCCRNVMSCECYLDDDVFGEPEDYDISDPYDIEYDVP